MRIRKHASKLLGSASLSLYGSPCQLRQPPPAVAAEEERPWDSTASAADAGLLCEVNRSPWDVMPADFHHSLLLQETDKEEENGAMDDGIGAKEEPISPTITSEADMKETGGEKKDKKKTRRKKTEKGTDSNGDTTAGCCSEVVVYCKKSDGKGWQCKRPALLPHSLCQYHLAQVRSYTYSHKVTDPPAATLGQVRSVRKKKADPTGAGTSFYYYYSGFGPWRGKRRGGGGGGGDGDGGSTAKEEEEEDEEGGRENSQPVEDHDAAVAGADEEAMEEDAADAAAAVAGANEEAIGEDDRGAYDTDDSEDSSDGGEEKRKNYRKRGRKPVKARSLKSLL